MSGPDRRACVDKARPAGHEERKWRMDSKKLVLVDGHSILNRAYYGMPDLTNSAGLHTGAVFGFLPGLLISIAGAAIGATVTYYLARFLGRDAMHLLFGEERVQHYVERLNSERAYVIVFLIYLIPGLPKDLVCYVAGVSEMKYKAFLLLSTVGRIPGMCGSLLFGHMFIQENYTGMVVVGVVVVVILILCLIFREKLRSLVDRAYKKLSE